MQAMGSPFVPCISNNYLYQTVNDATRICCDQNPSLLDLFIVSSPELLISNDYLPPPLEKATMLQFFLQLVLTANKLLISITHLLIIKLCVEI